MRASLLLRVHKEQVVPNGQAPLRGGKSERCKYRTTPAWSYVLTILHLPAHPTPLNASRHPQGDLSVARPIDTRPIVQLSGPVPWLAWHRGAPYQSVAHRPVGSSRAWPLCGHMSAERACRRWLSLTRCAGSSRSPVESLIILGWTLPAVSRVPEGAEQCGRPGVVSSQGTPCPNKGKGAAREGTHVMSLRNGWRATILSWPIPAGERRVRGGQPIVVRRCSFTPRPGFITIAGVCFIIGLCSARLRFGRRASMI